MTPLERAKAFVQSRAAKTALKIVPLALATATVAVPAAKANVVINPTDAQFSGCTVTATVTCSGGFVLASSTTGVSSLPVQGGVQGAHGQGSATGFFNSDTSNEDWSFTVEGTSGSSGSLASVPSLIASWDLSFPRSSDVIFGPATLTAFLMDSSGDVVVDSCFLPAETGSCTFTGLSILTGDLSQWSLTIDVPINSPSGIGSLAWDVNKLDLFAPPSTTPEPATFTLALAALPFLLRKRR